MSNETPYTDYLQGSVILDMTVDKQPNGWFKASCMGLESNHLSQEVAVRDLQDKLQEALQTGAISPNM